MRATMRRTETRARARALQALYAWDSRSDDVPLERVAMQLFDDLGVMPIERQRATTLIARVASDVNGIDARISEMTDHWRLERLGGIERCVLRLATAELDEGETPPKVVLQEAVRLAERFGSEQSAKFVNGVLDALARKLGRL
jgi:N utilization substance protein B